MSQSRGKESASHLYASEWAKPEAECPQVNWNSDATVLKISSNDSWRSGAIKFCQSVTDIQDQQELKWHYMGEGSKSHMMLPKVVEKGECFAPFSAKVCRRTIIRRLTENYYKYSNEIANSDTGSAHRARQLAFANLRTLCFRLRSSKAERCEALSFSLTLKNMKSKKCHFTILPKMQKWCFMVCKFH